MPATSTRSAPARWRTRVTTNTPGGNGHYLRQFGPTGMESAGIYRERLKTNRGSGYVSGVDLASTKLGKYAIGPNWDCANNNVENRKPPEEGPGRQPGCWVQPKLMFQGRLKKFSQLQPNDYGAPRR